MNDDLKAIYQHLQSLMGLHKQLLEALRKEKEALIQLDLKMVHDATCEKEALIEAIRREDYQRSGAVQKWLLTQPELKKRMDLSLSELVIYLQGDDLKLADQFKSVQNALQQLIARAKDQNRYNSELINRSIEHMESMKRNVLGEQKPYSETYTARGKRTDPQASSRLLSKEV